MSAPLSPREVEALQYYADGLTIRQVAQAMGTSVDTARTQLENARWKLEVGMTRSAAIQGIREGWLR